MPTRPTISWHGPVRSGIGGLHGKRDQVVGADSRPAVQHRPPCRWHRRRSPSGAEQGAGDRRGGVGVVAGPDREFQGRREMTWVGARRMGDGPPRRLQRMDDPAVVREVMRASSFRLVQQWTPELADGRVGGRQVAPHSVEGAGQHGMPDRRRPQLAGLVRADVVMGQRTHQPCGLRARRFVVQVGDPDRRGSHQGTVPTLATRDPAGRFLHCRRGVVTRGEHRPRLVADVLGPG